MRISIALLGFVLLTGGNISAQTAQTAPTVHTVFLIGDTGGFDPNSDPPVLTALTRALRAAGPNTSVVFLGDNIYPNGLPDSATTGRAQAEARLVQQLEAVRDTEARVFVIPGNHDWDHSGEDGLQAVRRQEDFVEDYLDKGNAFRPDDGLPGPETITLAEDVELVVVDTEWWLRDLEKGFGDGGRYETREEGDFIANMADVLRRKDDSRLLVVGHHPLMSNGSHAGRFPLKTHLFPLTELWDWAYLPLPVVGSLYPLAVSWFGGPQDLAHPRYRSLRSTLTEMFEVFPSGLIYASGHDHSLQYFPGERADYLVSGSASRPQYVGGGRGAAFTSSEPGFLELNYRNDGSVTLKAHSADALLYEDQIHPPRPVGTDLPAAPGGAPSDTATAYVGAAGPELAAGPMKSRLLGSAHRAAWTLPVRMPILDVGAIEGGLRPIQRGGGQQTVSVRLENENGHQFVLRSLAKDPTKTLPEILRETVARDIVLDQVSILHPYGALLVPPLAQAVGVYHATPRLFFVPDDARLAPYQNILAGRVMLFEERPDDDMSHAPQFGSSDDVIGAAKLYSEITRDNDHRVDARFFARNRVLDMYMSDWDRHEDQWRWASFEPADENGKIYRPIPRDRDWAFNRMNGFFPNIVQSRFVLPKFQEFKPEFGFMPGLNFNGLPQDRRLAASLTPGDWVEIADSVAAAITDEVIEDALARWPAEIQELDGETFRETFQARRAGLAEAVATYTDFLDLYVDVVMTDKHEEFVVSESADGQTRVTVHKTTKEGERRHVLYDRTFDPSRTHEIRLYGLGGTDRFDLSAAGRSIKIHVIGGTGPDELKGSASTGRNVFVYDTHGGISMLEPGHARLKLSDDPRVNRYDRREYRFNATLATILLGANEDNGLYLGGGPVIHRHAFRKLPFAARHRIRANSAARFGAFNVLYDGQVTEALGQWDVMLDAAIRSPNNIRNFFGLGNETTNDQGTRLFYQARLSEYSGSIGLKRPLSPTSWFSVSAGLQQVRVKADQGRFITQAGVAASTFEDQTHAAFRLAFVFDSRDSGVLPARGLHWTTSATAMAAAGHNSESYTRFATQLATYGSRGPHTLALRVGGQALEGPFPFWNAATLGGNSNLRGWRSTRFAGRTAAYGSAELRTRLGHFAGFLANGRFGVLGFFDTGRVWTDGEDSSIWHRGAGGGLWVSIFDALVLSTSLGFSEEQSSFLLVMGFQY